MSQKNVNAATKEIQDNKVNYQDGSELFVTYNENLRRSYISAAAKHEALNALRSIEEGISWDSVLLEAAYSALAEIDTQERRHRLVDVAAIAAVLVDFIDDGAYSVSDEDFEVPEDLTEDEIEELFQKSEDA